MEHTSEVTDQQPLEQGLSSTPETRPRIDFSHVIIALIFFVLGVLAALVAVPDDDNWQDQQFLIEQAVAAALNARDERNQPSAQSAQNNPNARVDVSVDDDPSVGPADAPIVMIEFSDFNCPYCGRFARDTLSPLLENYNGQVQFVYRDFPILGDSSLQAALAGKCADDAGVFWEYHDLLFENQGSFDRALFLNLAETLELDTAQFTACLDDPATSDEVLADFTEAQRLSISGTPTFFINGRRVVGAQPYQAFQVVIDEELAAVGNTTLSSEAPD